jgi:hypothetical protein
VYTNIAQERQSIPTVRVDTGSNNSLLPNHGLQSLTSTTPLAHEAHATGPSGRNTDAQFSAAAASTALQQNSVAVTPSQTSPPQPSPEVTPIPTQEPDDRSTSKAEVDATIPGPSLLAATPPQTSPPRPSPEVNPISTWEPDDQSYQETEADVIVAGPPPVALSEEALREREEELEEHFNSLGRRSFLAHNIPRNGRRQVPEGRTDGVLGTGAENATGRRSRRGLDAFTRRACERYNASQIVDTTYAERRDDPVAQQAVVSQDVASPAVAPQATVSRAEENRRTAYERKYI